MSTRRTIFPTSPTMRLALLMIGVFIVEAWLLVTGQSELLLRLFALDVNHVDRVWTFVTSVFAHGNPLHLFVNLFVFISFGTTFERVYDRSFTLFFLVTGVTTGLVTILFASVFFPSYQPIIGASGAISAMLGAMTLLYPRNRVYLFFVIPLPLWVAVTVFTIGSLVIPVVVGAGAFGIAHLAHGVGALTGVVYLVVQPPQERPETMPERIYSFLA